MERERKDRRDGDLRSARASKREIVKQHVRRYSVIVTHTLREMNEPPWYPRRNRAARLINTRAAELMPYAEFNSV